MLSCIRLPAEVLLLILEHISTSAGATSALASLCLTSPRLRSLAEPFLYTSFSNRYCASKPHSFPLSLIKRPYLAKNVRQIEIYTSDTYVLNPMPEEVLRCLRKAFDELGLPSQVAANYKELLGFPGPARAAICHELSLALASYNLESISVQLGGATALLDKYYMMNHIIFEQPNWGGKFDKVKRVFIRVLARSYCRQGLYDLAYLFKMPNLRHFEISGCKEHRLGKSLGWNSDGQLDTDLGQWRLVEGSSVDSIVFRNSVIGHCVINALLNCCKAVRQLYAEVCFPQFDYDSFRFSRLRDALCRHAGSLEHVAIVEKDDGKDQRRPGLGRNGPLLFLPDLRNLCSAVVPLNAIPVVGAVADSPSLELDITGEAEFRKYLPPSLEGISICDNNVHYGNTNTQSWFA